MRSSVALALVLLIGTGTQGNAASPREHIAAIESSIAPLLVIKGESPPPVTLATRMEQLHVIGVSVAVFNAGKIEWARAYGYADKERGVRATPDTLFEAGSISKPVAALAALQLVEKGKLDLDANVNDKLKSWHLPENSFTNDHKVTLRNILNHTAGTTVWGFPGYARTDKIPSTVEVLEGKGNTEAIRVWKEPGQSWRYSGGGYTIMQLLLTDVTGRSFPDLMRDTALRPLHMSSSTYEQPLPVAWRARAASGYYRDGSKVPGDWHIYPEMAAAGLWTTASDLARYALAVQRAYRSDGGILSSKMTHVMLTPGLNNHGLGPVITPDGKRFGQDEGFQASLTAYLDGSAGIAVMTNSDNGHRLADELMLTVAREYGWPGFAQIEKTVVHLPPEAYQRLVGRYQLDGNLGQFEITFKEGHLFVQDHGNPARELLAESETRLFDPDTLTPIEVSNENGTLGLNIVGLGHAVKTEERSPPTPEPTSPTPSLTNPSIEHPCDSPSTYPPPAYTKPALSAAQLAAMFRRPTNVSAQLQNLKRVFDQDMLAQPAFYSDEVLLELFNTESVRWLDATEAGEDNIIKPTRVARLTAHLDGHNSLEVSIGGNHKCLNERPDPANAYKKLPAHTYDAGYVHIRLPETLKVTLDSIRALFGDGSGGDYDVDCSASILRYLKRAHSKPDSERYLWNRIEFTVREADYARCSPGIGRAWFGTDTVRSISIRLIEQDSTYQLPLVY